MSVISHYFMRIFRSISFLFLLLTGSFHSYAQQSITQRKILETHIQSLRNLADSLEQALQSMPDAPVLTKNSYEKVKTHTKKIYVDKERQIFWQAQLPVYIFASSKPDGSDMTRIKVCKIKTMESHADPMYWEGPGKHYIKHEDADPSQSVAFEINADAAAPKSSVELRNAPKYNNDGLVFYGKGLTGDIVTTDEMSGVQQVYQSIDSAEYEPHLQSIAFDKDKEYTLNYYGVDRVGNVEKAKFVKFIVDLEAPVTQHTVQGVQKGDILAPVTTIQLTAKDQSAGVQAIQYRFDEQPLKVYTQPIRLSNLSEGEHTLTYYSRDHVKNEEEEHTYTFYLDRTAPKVTAEVIGDQHQNRGRVFISSRTKMRLTSVDNKAGVEKVFYSIDGEEERAYREPFPLIKSEGTHIIKFSAEDKVKNKSVFESSDSYSNMFLDLTLPDLKHSFQGPKIVIHDTTFISRKTFIRVEAKDPESGIQRTGYKIDGARSNPYQAPFNLDEEGIHTLEYYAQDNVNNRINESFFVVVDNTGPEIEVAFSSKPIGNIITDDIGQETKVYATDTYLFVTARDSATNVDKIYLSINNSQEIEFGKPVLLTSKGLKTIKVRAKDKLGNETVNDAVDVFIK